MGSPFAKDVAGLDIGGAFAKAVILYDQSILSSAVVPIGQDSGLAACKALDRALAKANTSRENIKHLVTTGKGAVHLKSPDQVVGNNACITRGISYLSRPVRTVIDLGERTIRAFRFMPKAMEHEFPVNGCTEVPLSAEARGENIAAAVCDLLERIGFEPVCALVGGRAKDPVVIQAVKGTLTQALFIPDDPQTVAALGAALIAEDTLLSPARLSDR
jgi:activator of 2-hydroxyglutaryl-CoA dehydratase